MIIYSKNKAKTTKHPKDTWNPIQEAAHALLDVLHLDPLALGSHPRPALAPV